MKTEKMPAERKFSNRAPSIWHSHMFSLCTDGFVACVCHLKSSACLLAARWFPFIYSIFLFYVSAIYKSVDDDEARPTTDKTTKAIMVGRVWYGGIHPNPHRPELFSRCFVRCFASKLGTGWSGDWIYLDILWLRVWFWQSSEYCFVDFWQCGNPI